MSRRGHGEGTIFQKENGRWVAQISDGHGPDGKRRRRKRTAATKTEARLVLREMQSERDDGLRSNREITIASLLDFFAKTVLAANDLSPNTVENLRWAIDGHLKPGLGHARLRDLTVSEVEHFLVDRRDTRGLSRSSLGRLRGTLARAIKEAQRQGWTHRNVADLAHVPNAKTAERGAMTRQQVAALLEVANGHRLEALIKLGLTRAMRPGELLGLRWQDLHLADTPPYVRIESSVKRENNKLRLGGLKTPSSRRQLQLPPSIVEELQRHRRRQAQERLLVGAAWHDLDLVFPTEIGTLVDPSNLRREFKSLCRRAGIGDWTPYELRHTAVSILSDGGVPIEQIADLAGHKDARTTMAVYRHKITSVVDGGSDIAAEILAPRSSGTA